MLAVGTTRLLVLLLLLLATLLVANVYCLLLQLPILLDATVYCLLSVCEYDVLLLAIHFPATCCHLLLALGIPNENIRGVKKRDIFSRIWM